jgi:hypothetical protein
MHEHPSHELSKQAACSLTTKSYEEPVFFTVVKMHPHQRSRQCAAIMP